MLSRVAIGLILLAAWTQPVWAQTTDNAGTLDDAQKLGLRLFVQNCEVCHTKPLLTAGYYGPALNRNAQGGDAAAMREVIANGSQRMPGFKYDLAAVQIDAIVQYLKTIPVPEVAAPTPPAPTGNARGPVD
jgi:mono/diheme cytochrome c family protein